MQILVLCTKTENKFFSCLIEIDFGAYPDASLLPRLGNCETVQGHCRAFGSKRLAAPPLLPKSAGRPSPLRGVSASDKMKENAEEKM